jgi:Fe2+ or Zn2+ uptake regulation protein
MDADLHATAAARLRTQGQRYTRNRRGIVEALMASDRPLTIPEVLAARDVPQSSAYRNMVLLEEAGVVRRILSGDQYARYELAEELTDHHHHFICSKCGAVEDVTLPTDVERAVERALKNAARRRRFQGIQHSLDLLGVCSTCA